MLFKVYRGPKGLLETRVVIYTDEVNNSKTNAQRGNTIRTAQYPGNRAFAMDLYLDLSEARRARLCLQFTR